MGKSYVNFPQRPPPEVTFELELTKEIIYLPLGYLRMERPNLGYVRCLSGCIAKAIWEVALVHDECNKLSHKNFLR